MLKKNKIICLETLKKASSGKTIKQLYNQSSLKKDLSYKTLTRFVKEQTRKGNIIIEKKGLGRAKGVTTKITKVNSRLLKEEYEMLKGQDLIQRTPHPLCTKNYFLSQQKKRKQSGKSKLEISNNDLIFPEISKDLGPKKMIECLNNLKVCEASCCKGFSVSTNKEITNYILVNHLTKDQQSYYKLHNCKVGRTKQRKHIIILPEDHTKTIHEEHVQINTRCSQLDQNNHCKIHTTKPLMCKNLNYKTAQNPNITLTKGCILKKKINPL